MGAILLYKCYGKCINIVNGREIFDNFCISLTFLDNLINLLFSKILFAFEYPAADKCVSNNISNTQNSIKGGTT